MRLAGAAGRSFTTAKSADELGISRNNPVKVVGALGKGGYIRLALTGMLVGLGTALGSGCTYGHGVCGLARLSRRAGPLRRSRAASTFRRARGSTDH